MTTKENTIKTVVDSNRCSGCGTCNAICPTHAIKMEFTTLGRLVPVIDETACVGCGQCSKVCPGNASTATMLDILGADFMGPVASTLFAKSTDKSIYENAQSGGAVTATLAYLFDHGRIDAALVVGQEQQKAQYRIVTTKQELFDCQSSQYTPVDLNSALPSLDKYEHVAVVGLPCHIEGIVKLKELFPERYANIEYLLGLICGGVLAQSCVEVVKRIAKKRIGDTDDSRIYWRLRKYSNYKQAKVAFVDPQGTVKTLDNNIRLSCKVHLTPPRCRTCIDKMNVCCDIAFGDSWGITGDDTQGGGNVIIARTQKGQALVDEILASGSLTARPCPISEIAKGQHLAEKRQDLAKVHQKEIDTFLEREKGSTEEAVTAIAKKVSRRAAWKRLTGKIRKLLKIG